MHTTGLKINFDTGKPFEQKMFSGLERVRGLYFIFLNGRDISYPFASSSLIYIGMSEKSSNSIYSRLSSHLDGSSGNMGITNYKTVNDLRFTYLNFESISSFWGQNVEDLESYFLLSFVKKYGVYPICNNKTGNPTFDPKKTSELEIDWDYFQRKK